MRTQSAPESKTNKIINELNLLWRSSYTELDIARYKREALKIKENVGIVEGFVLLSMIACFEKDLESMRGFSKRAIENPMPVVNFPYQIHPGCYLVLRCPKVLFS